LTLDLIFWNSGGSTMATTHQDKPSGKSGQRSRKANQRSQKSDQRQRPELAQPDANEQIGTTVASTDASTAGAAAPADVPSNGAFTPVDALGAVAAAEAASTGAVAAGDNFPISIQTVANAYLDYTKKSFQETGSFVEKLMGVRSVDQAIEVQTEFAKRAYENLVAESQKICELYSQFTKQIFKPWEGYVAKLTQAAR
jgi:phasin family protein